MLEDHTHFVNDASIIFIDKTDSTDLLKRKLYWRHTAGTHGNAKHWYHMALTFLKVYDCMIFVNYCKGWAALGL